MSMETWLACMFVHHVYLMLENIRGEHWIPWSWSYRQLGTWVFCKSNKCSYIAEPSLQPRLW